MRSDQPATPLPWLLLLGSVVLLGACTGGSGNSADETDGVVLSGSVTDAAGAPVAEARVTVDGIEAEARTDADGSYRIVTPYEPAGSLLVTAEADGFDTLVTRVGRPGKADAAQHELGRAVLASATAPDYLRIASPVPGATVVHDPCEPQFTIHGAAGKLAADSPLLDIVVLLDASGSTSRSARGGGSIYERQIEATRALVDELCNGLSRVALVRFAGAAELAEGLTADDSLLHGALDDLAAAGPTSLGSAGSGTDFATALARAQAHLAANPRQEIDGEDGISLVDLERREVVLLISDGIPTLPYGSGLTQQRADVEATLAAAQELADADIVVHTVAVEVAGKDRRLTTMPTLAHLTGGSFRTLDDSTGLDELLTGQGLTGVGAVTVSNPATGDSVTVTPAVDGCFTATISLTPGTQTLRVTAVGDAGGPGLSRELTLHAVGNPPAGAPQGLDPDGDIASIGSFTSPYGKTLDGSHGFASHLLASFPDLHESLGTQVFQVAGSTGDSVTVDVDLVARHAGWKNTIGYLVLTPAEALALPSATASAFAAAGSGAVLFDRSVFNGLASSRSFSAGEMRASFTTAAGNYIIFFLVANGTLPQGQSGARTTHFSLETLNGAGFDQMLSYWSADGWDGTGDPGIVLVIEDMPIHHRSDRDFWDLAISATQLVPALPPTCPVATD